MAASRTAAAAAVLLAVLAGLAAGGRWAPATAWPAAVGKVQRQAASGDVPGGHQAAGQPPAGGTVRHQAASHGLALRRQAAVLPDARVPGQTGVGATARLTLDLPVPQRDASQVRDATRRVLRRAEFQPAQRTPLEVAWQWLLERLGILLGQLAAGGAGSIIGLLLVLLVLAAVAFVAVRFSLGLTGDPAAAAALPAIPRRAPAEWRAEAEAHERAGEWRQAVRCRYRALVAELAVRGLVDEVPGRTAGEYRGEVRRNAPVVADDFAGATELFELAWYARWPTGRDDAGRLRTLSDRVLAGVRR